MRSLKTTLAGLFAIALLCLGGTAALPQDDIERHRSCAHCGMDRKTYDFSRMVVLPRDGEPVGVCSLHCAVKEIDGNPGRAVKSILVADFGSRKPIDAETAVWVMGGDRPGVMTDRPKWAFATRGDADAFIASHGGNVVSWAQALDAARVKGAKKHR